MITICSGTGFIQEDSGPECSNVLLDSRNLFSRCKADFVNKREHLQSTGICHDGYLDSNRTYGSWSNEVQAFYSIGISPRIPEPAEERRLHFESERCENGQRLLED